LQATFINTAIINKKIMKKFYAIIMIALPFFFQTANAQSQYTSVGLNPLAHYSVKGGNNILVGPDTLAPPSFGPPLECDTAPKLYGWSAPTTGSVFGSNSLGETECAEKYYATGTVNEVLVWVGKKKGTTGTTSAKIYSIDGTTKGPSATVLGTSAVVTTGSILTNKLTSYMFSSAVNVTSPFVISLVFPTTTGDTVAVVSNAIGCSTSDSLSWMNFPAAGGWKSTPSSLSSHQNTDLWIFPVGATLTGVSEYSTKGLSLLGAFPNPANDFTNIQYHIDEPGLVSVQVFDLSGRVIQNSSEKLVAGTHDIKVSLKDVAAGNYYYTVKTESAQLTSKFIVTK
jgi:hypothetical protein